MGVVHLYAKIVSHRRISFSESYYDTVNQSLCVCRDWVKCDYFADKDKGVTF